MTRRHLVDDEHIRPSFYALQRARAAKEVKTVDHPTTIYETASGRLLTHEALFQETVAQARQGWDMDTQGPFYFEFSEWLIEAINTGVIKERELIG